MSLPYNAGVPQGNQTIAETQDPILKNFSSIDTAFNGPAGGGTPFTTYSLQAATSTTLASNFTPAPVVGKGALYTTTTSANNTELAYINAANATALAPGFQGVRLTGGGITAAAYCTLQNPATLLPGSFNVSSIATGGPGVYTVNFTRNFANANYVASITPNMAAGGGAAIKIINVGKFINQFTFAIQNQTNTFDPCLTADLIFFGMLV